jgi:cytoskeleton protein RodZ
VGEAPAPGTEGPGRRLREAREAAGWRIERVAAELLLPPERVAQLEADDYSSFGPAVFARGYLRRCAALLGVPEAEVLAAYEACTGRTSPLEDTVALPPGDIPRPRPAWVGPALAVAVVALTAAGTWWVVASVPDESAPALALDAPMPDPEPPRESVRESVRLPVHEPGPAPIGTLRTGRPTPTVDEYLAAHAGDPVQPAPRPVAETTAGTVELRLKFSADCWLELTDASGERLAYRLARAGEVIRTRAAPPVSVMLGNAEGVELTVDGKSLAVRAAARRDGTARLTVGGGAG